MVRDFLILTVAIYRFIHRHGSIGGEKIEHALLDGLGADSVQGFGVGHELAAVEFTAGGDVFLGLDVIRLIVDDDKLAVLLDAAVDDALKKQLLSLRRVPVKLIRIHEQGEAKLTHRLFGGEHARTQGGSEQALYRAGIDGLGLARGDEARGAETVDLRPYAVKTTPF